MLHGFIQWIEGLSTVLPLPVFITIGSYLEEIVGPVPPFVVVTTAGALAQVRDFGFLAIATLLLLAAAGKTLGAYTFYYLGDKFEDMAVGRWGKHLGVSHTDVEKFGARFGKVWYRDFTILFLLRVIPFAPTLIVSLASGAIKLPVWLYLSATYVGYSIKDAFYLGAGYYGIKHLGILPPWAKWAAVFLVVSIILYPFVRKYLPPRQNSKQS
jgi:membrane protein DedA with SNARE-associated domain